MQCLLPKAINHPEKLPVSPSVPHPCTHPHVHHMHRYTQHTRMNTHRHRMHPDTRHAPTCATTRPRTHTVHTSSVWTHITHSHNTTHTHTPQMYHTGTQVSHHTYTTHTALRPHVYICVHIHKRAQEHTCGPTDMYVCSHSCHGSYPDERRQMGPMKLF